MKKTNIKKVKPAYVVDATWCNDEDDLKVAFICAKAGNTVITEDEIAYIISRTLDVSNTIKTFVDNIACVACDMCKTFTESVVEEKKLPWYKRLWNKVKGIFTR